MTSIWIENLLYTPRKCPKDIPIVFRLSFLPTSLFKVLNQDGLIKISLELQLVLLL
jgi:hypothetical protein